MLILRCWGRRLGGEMRRPNPPIAMLLRRMGHPILFRFWDRRLAEVRRCRLWRRRPARIRRVLRRNVRQSLNQPFTLVLRRMGHPEFGPYRDLWRMGSAVKCLLPRM